VRRANRDRLWEKFEEIKADPFEPQQSKPLRGPERSEIGKSRQPSNPFFRRGPDIIVAEIGPRGQIYKHGQWSHCQGSQ
jgi:hypothetical protein